jgi:hypothetical protein
VTSGEELASWTTELASSEVSLLCFFLGLTKNGKTDYEKAFNLVLTWLSGFSAVCGYPSIRMASGMGPNLLRLRCKTSTSLLTTLSGWLFSYERFSVREPHSTEILCKRISCIVAQTMVRQLVSKVQDVNLVGALAHIAEKTFDRIGRLNGSVHVLRKRIKGQQVLFILSQASYRFWIALAIFSF